MVFFLYSILLGILHNIFNAVPGPGRTANAQNSAIIFFFAGQITLHYQIGIYSFKHSLTKLFCEVT